MTEPAKTLLVYACDGRSVPIHTNDNPTGGAMILRPEDGAIELADSAGVRRRIRAGDLAIAVPMSATSAPPKKPEPKTPSEK